MNDEKLNTVEQVKQFLEGSEALKFGGISLEERYRWIETVLVRFKYSQLRRDEKGVIRRYIRESERILSGTGIPIDKALQATGAIKEGTLQKAQVPQEVYADGHCLVS